MRMLTDPEAFCVSQPDVHSAVISMRVYAYSNGMNHEPKILADDAPVMTRWSYHEDV
jgi:hypothetical protein